MTKSGPIIFLVLICIIACGENDSNDVLNQAQAKLKNASTVSYEYSSVWDNRFNESEFKSEASVAFVRVPEGDHGFGLHVGLEDADYVYDGKSLKEIDHTERHIVETPQEEVAADSNYFEGFIFFMRNPMQLRSVNRERLEVIRNDNFSLFVSRDTSLSVIDDSKTVINILVYRINNTSFDVAGIQTTTIIDGDTSQIIDHSFDALDYRPEPIDLTQRVKANHESYVTVNEEDLDNEMAENQIQVAEQLSKSKYTAIDENEIDLSQDTTVLMFSFIGCGGCEYAMKEMRNRDFDFRDDLKFYYASHIDSEETLKRYLSKKGYEGPAFSKESLINEEFGAWSFPTFFVLTPGGVVSQVYHGYSSEVESLLF